LTSGPPVTDLNADLGESFGTWRLGDDAAMMAVITSANIACGFHAGDPLTLRRACALAAERAVAIGAQVSYRDLAGFGRREMDVPAAELTAELLYQIAALDGLARVEGSRVRYVKPHGALYHRVARDQVQAAALVTAIASYDATLPLLTRPGCVAARLAEARGLTVIGEAFADRGYNDDGTLVPRSEPGAVRTDPAEVADRAVAIATRGEVESANGRPVQIKARSICVHSDTAGAVTLARAIRRGLAKAGVRLAPFA
jgi:UPF0271 protein